MNKKNWYRALSLADDKYVAEASPDNIIKYKKKRKIFISSVAACACFILLAFNLWLFIPLNTDPPEILQYKSSEYYEIIQKLSVFKYEKPKYKNNAQRIWASIKKTSNRPNEQLNIHYDDAIENGMQESVDGTLVGSGSNITDTYHEITDNQVVGVTEADRIKRSNTHIYYLDGNTLRIYSIDKENSKEVGSYTYSINNTLNPHQYAFYLSRDCKTITLIVQYYYGARFDYDRRVSLISLDVSDPANIVKKQEFTVTGEYISSRNVNGSILLMTEFYFSKQNLDFDNETTFLPQINDGDGFYSIPADNIVSPDTVNGTRYTVVMMLDESTLNIQGTAAYLSYSSDVYVSTDHVFLTHQFSNEKENDDKTVERDSMTEISCLAYGNDSFERKGSVTIRGYVKDQWSMDEREGILRVFTTTEISIFKKSARKDKNIYFEETGSRETNASLYCIDLTNFDIVASVLDFAPSGEVIESVRFDGDAAYVCTAIRVTLTDPVFFFDLSDLDNITYKDTGTIEGFSSSLINLENGYLLGIGVGNSRRKLKIEVYKETPSGVDSVCVYERDNADYSTNYKSYYVDRKNQLIGMGVWDHTYDDPIGENNGNKEVSRYILLHFDGNEIVELVNVQLDGSPSNMRGVYIDGYMYMLGTNIFKVEKVFGE